MLDKLDIDEDGGGKKNKKKIDRETEIPMEEEETQFKKALDRWEQADLPPPAEFTLVVQIESCLHLPISDHSLRDSKLVGSCDGKRPHATGGLPASNPLLLVLQGGRHHTRDPPLSLAPETERDAAPLPQVVGNREFWCQRAAYVKMTLGNQEQRTSVQRHTLYPEFFESFDFSVDRDHPRRR